MKKTYIIPTIKMYNAPRRAYLTQTSYLQIGEGSKGAGGACGNENSLDDQENTPWYK